MKFSSFITTILFILFILYAQATTTSYDADEYKSASSRALQSDATVIYDFILDLNSRYNEYLSYMDSNGMTFPNKIANYIVGIQTINDESALLQAIKTDDFPFSDFVTLATKFSWYTSIFEKAGVSTLYVPENFLTEDKVVQETSVSSSKETSSVSKSSSSLTSSSSSSVKTSSSVVETSSSSSPTSSSKSEESSSSSSASSSTSTQASSANNGSSYVPVLSLPALLAIILMI